MRSVHVLYTLAAVLSTSASATASTVGAGGHAPGWVWSLAAHTAAADVAPVASAIPDANTASTLDPSSTANTNTATDIDTNTDTSAHSDSGAAAPAPAHNTLKGRQVTRASLLRREKMRRARERGIFARARTSDTTYPTCPAAGANGNANGIFATYLDYVPEAPGNGNFNVVSTRPSD